MNVPIDLLTDKHELLCFDTARADGTYRAIIFHSLYPLARSGIV